MKPSHTHDFTYSASGADITATCTAENCTLSGNKVSLSITAPTLTIYGQTGEGISEKASLTDPDTFNTATELTISAESIKYYKATKSGTTYTKSGDALTAAPTDAGDYIAEITISGVKTSEGTDKSVTASVGYTIGKATLSNVSVSDVTLTYNGSAQTPNPTTAATAVNGQTVTFTYSKTQTGTFGTMPAFTNVSDSGTVYYKASALNHSDATGSFTVTVNKADQTAPAAPTAASVTVNSVTLNTVTGCEYSKDGTNWQDSPIFNGLTMNTQYTFYQRLKETANYNASPGSSANISTSNHTHNWSFTAGTGENANTLTATCSNTDGGHSGSTTATLTISAASGTYDGTTSYGATITGNIEGVEIPAISYFRANDAGNDKIGSELAGAPIGAGKYWAEITLGTGNKAATAHVVYSISKADPIATAPTGLTATYGQTLANVTLTNPTGNTPGSWAWADSSTGVGNAGSHTFKANFTPTDTANYNSKTNVDVTVNVGKADSAVTKAPTAKDLTYTGSDQNLVTAGEASGGTMQYALGTGATTAPTSGWSTSIPTGKGSGIYYVFYKAAGDSNHNDSAVSSSGVSVEIKKKDAGIEWKDTEFTYDGNAHKPTATLSGVISTDTCTASVSGEQTNAGTSYTATASLSGGDSGNYYIPDAKKTCSFKINKADISKATVTVTLGSALTYNGAEQSQTVSKVTVNGRDLAASDYSVTDNKGTNAGKYTLTVTAKENSNYTGVVTKEFTIAKKAITPTVTVSGSYTFTGSDITPTFTVKDGTTNLAETDYTASIADNKNAGTGKVTVSAKEGGNYSFSSVTKDFTINKAAAQSLADIQVEQTYTKTSVSEPVAGKMPGDAGTLTFKAGTATITKVSGSTASVSSFTVDEKGIVSATIINGTAGDIITLPVTISSTNYADSAVNVVVTLLPKTDAAVTIMESDPVNKSYGDDDFTLDAVAGDPGTGSGVWTWESSDEKVATVTNEGAVTVIGVGESIIKAHYESDTTVGEATVTLKVSAKALGIVWSDTELPYDGNPHKPTATITGVKNGDDCTVTVSGEQIKAGSYTATATLSGADSGNYYIPEDKQTCSFNITRVKVTSIKITGTTDDPAKMQKGEKLQLGATVTPANATGKTVRWTSSDTAIVTVDSTGLITAIAEGEAVITAEAIDDSGVKATLNVVVAPFAVEAIELRVSGGTVMVPGGKQQIEAVIIPADAADKELAWTSSDTDIATVDNGLVTVKKEIEVGDGKSFTVTATSRNNVSASVTFTVKKDDTKVTSVEIDKQSVKTDARPGDSFRITAVIKPSDATDKTVTWDSSDKSVAEISSTGIVNVKGYGKTTITVTAAGGKSDTAELDIAKVPVQEAAMDSAGVDNILATGKSVRLKIALTPVNATVKEISWKSSDPDVVSVDANGTVTGKKAGKATITATVTDEDGNKKTCELELIIFDDDDSLYVEFADGSDYSYTGKKITPLINVYNRGRLLMEGTDYTVKFSNNIDANDGTDAKKAPRAVVTGKTIAATSEAFFRILPLNIGDETIVTAEEVNVAYGKTAAPLLFYGGIKLGAKDFTNLYAKEKFTASRAITVYGKGNFTGEREVWINVMDSKEIKNVPKIKVQSFKPAKKVYNGRPQTIGKDEIKVVSASDKNKELEMDKDFFIAYPEDITNVGTVKITVIGMGAYAGSVGKTYNIEAAKKDGTINKIDISFPDKEGQKEINGVTYDTFEYRPGGNRPLVEILVTRGGRVEALSAGRDYNVAFKNNTKAGALNKDKPATVTITFIGNYKSIPKQTKDFYIERADLGKAITYAQDKTVTKAQPKYPLSAPVVDRDGVTVKKNEYTVTYMVNDGEKNIEVTSKDKLYKELKPGESITVSVEVSAKKDKAGRETGNYTGTAQIGQYNITYLTKAEAAKDISKAKVIIQKKGDPNHKAVTKLGFTGKPIVLGTEDCEYELYVYTGKKAATPDKVLKEGTDFQAEYSNNVNAGRAAIILNGIGDYSGSKTFSFNIVKGRIPWTR